jgi:hypothetical protein
MSESAIRETRQLVLPLQTVLDAVVQYDRRSFGLLSRGEIVQAELIHDLDASQRGMNIAVMLPDESVIEWRRFDINELAAAIIDYCRSKKIPLPYAGSKWLSISKEGAAFSIENTVDVNKAKPPQADFSGRPLRYAKGYEPYALEPVTRSKVAI